MKRRAYVLQAGDVTGPFYEAELMKRFDSGELLADDQVCEQGKEEWIALGDWLASATVSAPPMLLPPAQPTNWGIAGSEQPYFQALGIAVTRTRLIVGPQTYAMSGVTSVRVDRRPPELTGAIALSVVGALPLVGSLGMLIDPQAGWNWWLWLLFWFLLGLTLLALGIWIGRLAKPTFLLFIRTSGGEVGVWNSKDAVAIQSLNSALNRAIVERG